MLSRYSDYEISAKGDDFWLCIFGQASNEDRSFMTYYSCDEMRM